MSTFDVSNTSFDSSCTDQWGRCVELLPNFQLQSTCVIVANYTVDQALPSQCAANQVLVDETSLYECPPTVNLPLSVSRQIQRYDVFTRFLHALNHVCASCISARQWLEHTDTVEDINLFNHSQLLFGMQFDDCRQSFCRSFHDSVLSGALLELWTHVWPVLAHIDARARWKLVSGSISLMTACLSKKFVLLLKFNNLNIHVIFSWFFTFSTGDCNSHPFLLLCSELVSWCGHQQQSSNRLFRDRLWIYRVVSRACYLINNHATLRNQVIIIIHHYWIMPVFTVWRLRN